MEKEKKADTPEQAEFRAYCREWLSKNRPGPPPDERTSKSISGQKTPETMAYLRAWQRSAYEGGLVGCDYPKEYGGGGRTDCQRIANEELQKIGTPIFPNDIALGFGAATILTHGSEELKKRFIPKMFSCEEMWCQGFSEPNAGSDVANQETFAEKQGDNWVVNGQKVWTSLGEWADWMILLCRTDRSQKHRGLTYFVAPIKENLGKSVEVRPLIKMTGETGFNEVFFNDMVIPDSYRLDDEGSGWTVAMTTLMFERNAGPLVAPTAGYRQISDESEKAVGEAPIIQLAKNCKRNGKPVADDPVIRDRLMQIIIRQTGFEQNNRRNETKGLVDHPSRIPLQAKLVRTEIQQDQTALAVDIEGAASTLYIGDQNAPEKGIWPYYYLASYGGTIAAGTSEIQRNQLGERVLSLPKSK